MKAYAYAIAAAVLFAGCSTVEICREGGHDMCYVCTSEWVLISCIPVFSGNPNGHGCLLFHDTAKMESNISLLEKAMDEGHYVDIINPVSFSTEESMIPFIFSRRLFHTSAELVMASQKTAPHGKTQAAAASTPQKALKE